jgi:flagellar basal-body rod protein FlgF
MVFSIVYLLTLGGPIREATAKRPTTSSFLQTEKGASKGRSGMVPGLYSAATALDSSERNHEIVSHNLAHANVPGYRSRGVAFETFDRALADAGQSVAGEGLHGTAVERGFSNFQTGPVQHTGNPFDVALTGDGFFVVQGPQGPLYTRNGTFTLTNGGELRTQDGRQVLGTAGPITLPENAQEITVGRDGTIFADGSQIGQLQLARFSNPSVLEPVGTTLFAAPAGTAPEPLADGRVQQGYREGANVQVVNEMVSMIAGMRHFEASQRALRTISESIQLNTRPTQA